jgi:small subunit ribosomal protein S6
LKQYEETIVFDGSLENEQINAELKKVEDIIQSHGATISDINRWGRRKMAYPIRKKEQGYYVIITFETDGPSITGIEHEYELNEAILRYLTIAVEKQPSKQEEA